MALPIQNSLEERARCWIRPRQTGRRSQKHMLLANSTHTGFHINPCLTSRARLLDLLSPLLACHLLCLCRTARRAARKRQSALPLLLQAPVRRLLLFIQRPLRQVNQPQWPPRLLFGVLLGLSRKPAIIYVRTSFLCHHTHSLRLPYGWLRRICETRTSRPWLSPVRNVN
jgi:hypothetical protein